MTSLKKIRTFLLLILTIVFLSACDFNSQTTITSIEVDETTLEDNYDIDTFDLSSINIKVSFSDGKYQLVPLTEAMLSAADKELLLSLGEHKITVTYQGKTTTITLNLSYSDIKKQLLTIYNLATTQGGFDGTYEDWLDSIKGPRGEAGADGKAVSLQVAGGFIQWKYVDDPSWKNLVELATLVGPAGKDGADGEDGVDGKEVTFRVAEGYIQWQYDGDDDWTNLVSLSTLTGATGADAQDVVFQAADGFIQWKYVDDPSWKNLVELATLVGPAGKDGKDGVDGKQVTFRVFDDYIQWQYVGDESWTNLVSIATLTDTAGANGKSAYEIYKENNPSYDKSESEWIEDLVNGRLATAEKTKYTVTFDSNGGSSVANQQVYENQQVTKPADPTRNGYIFEGWYVGEEQWSFVGYSVSEDIVLVARWKEIVPFSITGATYEDNVYIILVDANAETINFADIVHTDKTWYLSKNIYGTLVNVIKIALLEPGDNTFYIFEEYENDYIVHEVSVQRVFDQDPIVLATPVVIISEDGFASWGAVANASGYLYKINDGEEQGTLSLSVELQLGDSIVVKAVGDNEYYLDSIYSDPIIYEFSEHEHTDADDNGICDGCHLSVIETFDIFSSNDLHGKFNNTETYVGVDELTTYLLNAKEENPLTLILSVGDMWQGGSESNLTRGAIIMEWMNYVGFDTMTLGNHEFDWTHSIISQNAGLVSFPILAINVYYRDTDTPADFCSPSVLITKGNTTIGIIGAIGNCYGSIEGSKVSDLYFKTGSELTDLVKAEATRLRNLGADYIIYTIHDGFDASYSGIYGIPDDDLTWYDPSLSDGYIDIVFEGHTHQVYILKDSRNVFHLQGGGDNTVIPHVEVSINFVTGSSVVNSANLISSEEFADESIPDDPIVEDLLEKYYDQISISQQVLGQNDVYRGSSELANLAAQMYVEAGIEKWGDTYDIVLGGGSINPRSPYCLYPGTITYGDVQTIFTFDNDIQLCSILGIDLLDHFINNESYYVSYSDYGNSIKDSIIVDETYYIITDTWNSSFTLNNLTIIENYDYGIYARDLIAEYIRNGGMTSGPNLIVLDTPVVNISEDGVAYWAAVPHAEGYVYAIDDGEEHSTDELSMLLTLGQRIVVKAVGDNITYADSNYSVSKVYGTVEYIEPTPISDILEIGNNLAANAQTTEEYYVRGRITSIDSTIYGNLYLEDEAGNVLYVYGVYDSTGSIRYDSLENKPQVGDVIILQGVIKKYKNANSSIITIEMINGKIVDEDGVIVLTSIPIITAIGENLEANAQTTEEYYVRGRITSIDSTTYGNVYIENEKGQTLYIYGIYDSTGTIRYDSLENKPQVGDVIILQGVIKKYKNANSGIITIEMINGKIVDENEAIQNLSSFAFDYYPLNTIFVNDFVIMNQEVYC
jgi:uncharacterized repeat protein (TIGR02543 family)